MIYKQIGNSLRPSNVIVLLLLLMGSTFLQAQAIRITGKITNEKTGDPIEYASVFLPHSTIGTATLADGTFTLEIQNQQALHLIISHIAFTPLEVVLPHDKNAIELDLQMKPKQHILQSVDVIKSSEDRKALINTFKGYFFGETRFGYKCKIENPEVLDFITHGIQNFSSWQFIVLSNGAIEYTNKALGYNVKYTLVDFYADYYHITYFGYPLYKDVIDEMPNSRRIIKNRRKAFAGSKLHFFRSLLTKRIKQEGFEVYKIDLFLKDTADVKNYGLLEDSVFIGEAGIVMLQTDKPLDIERYVYMNFATGIPELLINEPFEIRYTRAKEEAGYIRSNENFMGMNNTWGSQTSIVKLKNGKIQFYKNGSLDNSSELMTIGYWSYKRMGDFLPFDYVSE